MEGVEEPIRYVICFRACVYNIYNIRLTINYIKYIINNRDDAGLWYFLIPLCGTFRLVPQSGIRV